MFLNSVLKGGGGGGGGANPIYQPIFFQIPFSSPKFTPNPIPSARITKKTKQKKNNRGGKNELNFFIS